MRLCGQKLGIWAVNLVLLALLVIAPAFAADKNKSSGKETFTGVVSDSMCGAKHMMPGDAVGCAHACLKQGSKYALVVGDKVYTLETSDKVATEELDKRIGQTAKVSGTANGDTIQVNSVSGS
jgi:hypothetical protein